MSEDNYDKDNYDIGIFDPEGKNPNPLNGEPYSDEYKNLAKFWSNLPGYEKRKKIVQSIEKNDVILVIGATGAGKSLLLPKFCLHAVNYTGHVVMTLPKKIITKKAAEFGAQTLDVPLGEQVGYQFRGESVRSDKTVLLYSTDGSIISQIKSDPLLRTIDIILIDEAHERKVQIDLLLYLLKNAIKMRKEGGMKPLKLIIMSATINEKIFAQYYKEFAYDYIFLSGTPNFPIETIYLESSLDIKTNKNLEEGKKIITEIVRKINSKTSQEGDILFFVCRVRECNEIALELEKNLPDCFTMGLYSGVDKELEQYISSPTKFKELNPKYKRRIFVATNVAESSLTIDGIVYVVDSGLEIAVKYEPKKQINVMEKRFITKAQMTQRKGRAGRTKAGFCYKIYTPQDEENTGDFPEPEIKKIDLKNVCLSLLTMGTKINSGDFDVEKTIKMFTDFIEPPLEDFIVDGFDFSYKNGLIGSNNKLSNIGQLVVETRLDLTDALTLLYAYNTNYHVFRKVFKIICICSFLKTGPDDLFYADVDKNKKTSIIEKLLGDSYNSEHILLLQIYNYIKETPDESIFNLELFNQIKPIYKNQITKLVKIYDRYAIKFGNINKDDTETNIIYSFNYGFKESRAFKSDNQFKFNGLVCNLDKAIFDFNKYSSIIFYSNINISGKLNISVISPYLFKE